MTLIRFDGENTFTDSINKGLNLFIGAGFSIYAKNFQNENLLLGNSLRDRLKEKFNIDMNLSLSQISTILERTKRADFYKLLFQEFTVDKFDQRYIFIDKLKPKKIYTTNIDNLIHKIYDKIDDKFINDVTYQGESTYDPLAVDFSALHGNVEYKDRQMIFDVASINNAYSGNKRIWNQLALDFERRPTLFWGYGLNDTGVIQALTSDLTSTDNHKDKWIILMPQERESAIYFESLGFQIIISDTNDFLDYIKDIKVESSNNKKETLSQEEQFYFGNNLVPRNTKNIPLRPILEFFSGNAPTWSDILSNQIFKTHHFNKIKEAVYSKSNIIIQGAPVSGKTTLMMQIAFDANKERKLIYDNLSLNKAKLLAKVLEKKQTIIFIDNFADSWEAFEYLSNHSNIQIVGVDRTHNFSIISHIIELEKFKIFNTTHLTEGDYQAIYDRLPLSNRSEKLISDRSKTYDTDTLYEFVKRNVKHNNITERFREVFNELKNQDFRLTEFLVLTAYVHNARIPISFEMLYSYFIDDIDSYEDVYRLKDHLADMIKDYSGDLHLGDQDYYYPRSYYLAETILNLVDSDILRTVMEKTLENVPNTRVPYYHTFRKYAYDKSLVLKAFKSWEKGKDFFNDAYHMDFKNPFILQQGALYLAAKKKFRDAFIWIDRAITQTNNKYFSIRNSHAIILFDANINNPSDDLIIRQSIDRSMDILEKCFMDDKRKIFHARRFAEQTLEYIIRYHDDKATEYLTKAKTWLKSEKDAQKNWDSDLNRLLFKLNEVSL